MILYTQPKLILILGDNGNIYEKRKVFCFCSIWEAQIWNNHLILVRIKKFMFLPF